VYDKSCGLGLQARGRLMVHGPCFVAHLGRTQWKSWLSEERVGTGVRMGDWKADWNKTYLRTLVVTGASGFFAFWLECDPAKIVVSTGLRGERRLSIVGSWVRVE